MMSFGTFLLGLGGVGLSGLVAIYIFRPGTIFTVYMVFSRWAAGLKRRSTRVGKVRWMYSERGQPCPEVTSLVLVHGFTGASDSWNWMIKNMPASLHIVAVDLPGHGETEADSQEEMTMPYDYYVSNLYLFLQNIGLGDTPVHMIGLSMGGAISGLYTAAYPQHVKMVTLICPAMNTPIKAKLFADIESSTSMKPTLVPETAEEQRNSLRYAVYKEMKFPNQFFKGMVDIRRKYVPFFNWLGSQLTLPESNGVLNKAMDKIAAPAHILWGEEDYIVHVSGAQVLKENIRDIRQYDIIPKCGHAMDIEKPQLVAKRILNFRNSVGN